MLGSVTYHTAGMSNMRPFASTPASRTKDTVIWSFNGQNCSFYNLNWINVRRSQKNCMLCFIQNDFYTWKYDRLFPSVKNILNKENVPGRMSSVALMKIQMWPKWPSGDPRFDMPAIRYNLGVYMQTSSPAGWHINFPVFIREHCMCSSWSVHCHYVS
jgi:hypothetical protein